MCLNTIDFQPRQYNKQAVSALLGYKVFRTDGEHYYSPFNDSARPYSVRQLYESYSTVPSIDGSLDRGFHVFVRKQSAQYYLQHYLVSHSNLVICEVFCTEPISYGYTSCWDSTYMVHILLETFVFKYMRILKEIK